MYICERGKPKNDPYWFISYKNTMKRKKRNDGKVELYSKLSSDTFGKVNSSMGNAAKDSNGSRKIVLQVSVLIGAENRSVATFSNYTYSHLQS